MSLEAEIKHLLSCLISLIGPIYFHHFLHEIDVSLHQQLPVVVLSFSLGADLLKRDLEDLFVEIKRHREAIKTVSAKVLGLTSKLCAQVSEVLNLWW